MKQPATYGHGSNHSSPVPLSKGIEEVQELLAAENRARGMLLASVWRGPRPFEQLLRPRARPLQQEIQSATNR